MNAKRVTEAQILAAAEKAGGLRVYNLRPAGKRPGSWNFTLKTDGGRWRKFSDRERQKVDGGTFNPTVPGAVCWHGHGEFLRELFRLAPDAVVKTAIAIYRGEENFLRGYPYTYDEPVPYFGFYGKSAGETVCQCDLDRETGE